MSQGSLWGDEPAAPAAPPKRRRSAPRAPQPKREVWVRPEERFAAPDIESVVHRWMLDPQNSDACRECVPFPPFVRVGCPTCGAQVGEPCLTRDGAASGSQTSSEPWASDVWATAHGERHGILSTVRGLEAVHDPEHCGWEPHPEHWGVAWLHGNDGPLGEIHASRRAERAKGDARKRTKAARDAQLGMKV